MTTAMRTFLSQLRTQLILGALVFLVALTGAVILAVRDSLLFAARDTARLGAEGLLSQSEAALLQIARREAALVSALQATNPEHLSQHLDTLGLTASIYGFVIDAEGRLLAVSPGSAGKLFGQPGSGDDAAWQGHRLQDSGNAELAEVVVAMQAGQSATARLELGGEPVVMAYAPLGAVGGSLALVEPTADITALAAPLTVSIESHIAGILRATLLTIGYFGAIAMVAAVVAARALTHPLQNLAAGTRAVAQGDLTVRIPETLDNEVGRVAQSFNQMASTLQARSAELGEAYQLLEQRVQERTRELASLLEVSRTIGSTLELDPLLDLVLEQLHLVVDYTSATIASLEAGQYRVHAYRGPGPAEPFLQLSYPADDLLHAERMQLHTPVIIADLHGETLEAAQFRQQAAGQMATLYRDVHALMSLPLVSRDTLTGTLTLHHQSPGYYTEKQADLALAFADLAAVALENARLYKDARTLAVFEERQRLARDLHDSVTQSLYSLTLLAEAARRTTLAGDSDRSISHVVRLGETAQQALKEMRLLVYQLRPLALETAGLVEALQHRLDAVEKRAGVTAQLRVDLAAELPSEVEEGLYHIALEALNNALKHAGARSVTVVLRSQAGQAELEVIDSGKGFDPAARDRAGLGLVSMGERAEALRGRCSITSAPGEGTRVRVSLRW
jgi:signal transduction histidine kinase/HAMP domain-containing protein